MGASERLFKYENSTPVHSAGVGTMANIRHPRRGSLQYWPRKRAASAVARLRSWPAEAKAKPLGFIGFKAGMTHVIATDNRPKSLTKGEKIALPSTVIECPSLTVMGIVFYQESPFGDRSIATILAPLQSKEHKELSRTIPLPKKNLRSTDEVSDFHHLRLLVQTHPKQVPGGAKKPHLMELAVGGSKEEQLSYAKQVIGKNIAVSDVFESGAMVDVHGITKGKGFQGTVKRFGIPIRQHKAEKTKRGIGTLGSWTPKRVEFTVAQPGKMGFHLRTEYNKQILLIDNQGEKVNPPGGRTKYGLVRNQYLLLKGSVMGPRKRPIALVQASRPDVRKGKDSFEITAVARRG